jgi:hypothetical protein
MPISNAFIWRFKVSAPTAPFLSLAGLAGSFKESFNGQEDCG